MTHATRIIQRRRRREERQAARQQRNRLWLFIIGGLFIVLVILPAIALVGGAFIMYEQATRDLPTPQQSLSMDAMIGPSRLYDRTGETLLLAVEDPLGEDREWITLAMLPDYVIDATLIMEDPGFLTRGRSSLLQTGVRLWQNALNGPVSMDPTLTGRLVRNAIAPPADQATTTDREREIALVAALNRRYSPQEILEWHLNTNFYGNEAYGIDAAAQVYLGKRAADLTLDEAALLAAIPPAPAYNPLDNEVAARGRQDDVLRAMLQAGQIDSVAYDLGITTYTPVQFAGGQTPELAPEFSVYARRQARDILDNLGYDGARLLSRGGLNIITTLDMDLYYQAECTLRTHLSALAGDSQNQPRLDGAPCDAATFLPQNDTLNGTGPDEGALVVLDIRTGEIRSLVGPVTSGYQPGPTLQPFVYFESFRTGATTADMVLDIPQPFPGAVDGLIYTPSNADGLFRGPINLRDAMSAGLLPPVAQLAYEKRIGNILASAHRLGLNSLDENARYDLSLLERGGQVSVLDITYAYTVFSAMGEMRGIPVTPIARNYRRHDPVAVLRIEDADGALLWEYAGAQYEPDCAIASNCTLIFDDELGYLMNDVLADQTTRARILGENAVRTLSTGRPTALINGMTGNQRDSWTVGYTPLMAVGVHLGRSDEGEMMLDSFGTQGAGPVWRALMDYVYIRDNLPPDSWQRPSDIVELMVCDRSGMLPNEVCPTRRELFINIFQPTQTDTYWRSYDINSSTNQLATVNTPAGLRSERVYFIPPNDARDWWESNQLPLPPTEHDTVSRPALLGAATLLQPAPFAYIGGVVDIRGSMDASNMQFYQLAYGQGLNPTSWTQIGGQQTEYNAGTSLGLWDTTGLDGLYSLRLTVVLQDNTLETDVQQVTIDNKPPTISLSAGEAGQTVFRWPQETVISLKADVVDNLATDRVEFYHNGEFIGTDEEWPWGFDWTITRVGIEQFSAVAFDAVGNQTSSELTVEVIRTE